MTRPRKPRDAVFEALPELLAAVACGVALADPDWPGFDLLRTAGPLFFVEFPLALITLFAGVMRLGDHAMDRATKRSFVLVPTFLFGAFAFLLLGFDGLIAVAWLSAGNFYRLATGAPPSSRAVPGFFMTYTTGDDGEHVSGPGISMKVRAGPRRKTRGKPRTWRVQGGVEQLEAGTTIVLSVLIATALFLFGAPGGNVTAAYAESVGWATTVLGQVVTPNAALWAGALLFGTRFIGKLDFGPAPVEEKPVRIEDDPVLREIVRKVGSGSKRKAK